ncbi:MAG: hypothetical protein FWH33_06345 [Oscillospiraceae bacterium]|nr:hypothetical protein [Oscillospiraceae bacterium]
MWNIIPDIARQDLAGRQTGLSWTKGFVVIGIPVFFLLVHLYSCLIRPKRARPVSKKVMYWVNPIISILCFIVFATLSFIWGA